LPSPGRNFWSYFHLHFNLIFYFAILNFAAVAVRVQLRRVRNLNLRVYRHESLTDLQFWNFGFRVRIDTLLNFWISGLSDGSVTIPRVQLPKNRRRLVIMIFTVFAVRAHSHDLARFEPKTFQPWVQTTFRHNPPNAPRQSQTP